MRYQTTFYNKDVQQMLFNVKHLKINSTTSNLFKYNNTMFIYDDLLEIYHCYSNSMKINCFEKSYISFHFDYFIGIWRIWQNF